MTNKEVCMDLVYCSEAEVKIISTARHAKSTLDVFKGETKTYCKELEACRVPKEKHVGRKPAYHILPSG